MLSAREKKEKADQAAAEEERRRLQDENNEQRQWEAHERNRDHIHHLEQRLTLMQQELWALRQEHEEARKLELAKRRSWF